MDTSDEFGGSSSAEAFVDPVAVDGGEGAAVMVEPDMRPGVPYLRLVTDPEKIDAATKRAEFMKAVFEKETFDPSLSTAAKMLLEKIVDTVVAQFPEEKESGSS